jgi:molecular chaperone GrpE
MTDRDERRPRVPGEDVVEVRDTGDSLDDALAQEETAALAAAEDKLRSLQKDLEELKDRHLRKLAEFENHKKRSEKERQEYFKIALAGFAHDFLPILDNFERAVTHARPQDLESDVGQGILIIRKQLAELWKRYGLIPIDSSGTFDPNLHEAVATVATDSVPPNTIVEELQKGFFLNDKLIRPALVKVAVRPGEADDASQ